MSEKKEKKIAGKNDIVQLMREKYGISQRDARETVERFINALKETMRENDSVQLVGFGTFNKYFVSERQGINFHTKEAATIPAYYRVSFKAGKHFKEALK